MIERPSPRPAPAAAPAPATAPASVTAPASATAPAPTAASAPAAAVSARPVVVDDDLREAPSQVVAGGALGIAPLPFLAIYAVLFISHGTFHPVVPPDITTTKHGELLAGLIALALLIIGLVAVVWFMNGRRRWLFVLAQAATVVTCVDFLIDRTTGSPIVPVILLVTSATGLVLAVLPEATAYVRRPGSSGFWERLRARTVKGT